MTNSLIMVDMQMPGIPGNQVLDYIKDHKSSPMPVIGMSGTPWLLNREKFDVTLSKPADLTPSLQSA